MSPRQGETQTHWRITKMNLTAARIIDTLEELIATAGMMSKEQIENAVQGSAIWVWDHMDSMSTEDLDKIDRLQDRLLAKAA
jgi:hypothetical protein